MKNLISLLFIISISFAQQAWIRTYGGTSYDYGSSAQQTLDGGYIVVGVTLSFGAGLYDVYLIKTDSTGDMLWTRTYGGIYEDLGASVQQTRDGGYVIIGYTKSYGAGANDVYLIKTDSTGDTLWTKTYGGIEDDLGYSIQQTSDDGYIIVGVTWSFGSGHEDYYLIKTDSVGDTLWTRTYGGINADWGSSVQQTRDGGYIIIGCTESYGAGANDVYLIKTDYTGDTLWTRTYGGTLGDVGTSVQQASDGGYIVAGYTAFFGVDSFDVYIIKTDSIGDTLWTRTYGGTDIDYGFSIQQTTDNGYIIAGLTQSFGAGNGDVYLIKTDSTGDTLWTRTYGQTWGDLGNSVQQTSDGGYIIAGYTWNYGAELIDVFLIKTDGFGNAAVEDRIGTTRNIRSHLFAIPNPFVNHTCIPDYEREDFIVSDITGRLVGKYKGAKIGENLPAGVYFILSQNKNIIPLRIVKIR